MRVELGYHCILNGNGSKASIKVVFMFALELPYNIHHSVSCWGVASYPGSIPQEPRYEATVGGGLSKIEPLGL